MQPFQNLAVWQKAHQLTLQVYIRSKGFPSDERFGLTSQLRRSASSTAANIAEGCARDRRNEFAQFLRVALGSATETEYHLLLARDLGYLSNEQHESLTAACLEIQRMLASFIRRLAEQPAKKTSN